MGMCIGKGSVIFRNTEILGIKNITIGENTIIGWHCLLDGRGGLRIGNNVNISSYTLLVAGNHDIQSENFEATYGPIEIDDYVWLGTRVLVLPSVRIGRGAVVAAGAVVTKDVASFKIVAGVPAQEVGERRKNLNYTQRGFFPLF